MSYFVIILYFIVIWHSMRVHAVATTIMPFYSSSCSFFVDIERISKKNGKVSCWVCRSFVLDGSIEPKKYQKVSIVLSGFKYLKVFTVALKLPRVEIRYSWPFMTTSLIHLKAKKFHFCLSWAVFFIICYYCFLCRVK